MKTFIIVKNIVGEWKRVTGIQQSNTIPEDTAEWLYREVDKKVFKIFFGEKKDKIPEYNPVTDKIKKLKDRPVEMEPT